MKYKLLLIISIVVFLSSCDDGAMSTDSKEALRQEQLQAEGQAQAGLPGIHNFQEKKLLKMIYEL